MKISLYISAYSPKFYRFSPETVKWMQLWSTTGTHVAPAEIKLIGS